MRAVCPKCPCPGVDEEFTTTVYNIVDTCDEEGKPTAYGEEWVDPDSYNSKGFVCQDCGERFDKPLVLTEEEWQKRHEEWTTIQDETAAGAKTIEVTSGSNLLDLLGLEETKAKPTESAELVSDSEFSDLLGEEDEDA